LDFYITAQDGTRYHLPINPDKVTCSTGARMISFDVMDLGGIEIPKGSQAVTFSWEGTLPGEGRKNMSFVKDWRKPMYFIGAWSGYRNNGEKLRLLITETPINHDIYIKTLEHTWGSSFGDCNYKIELVQARELKIYTEDEWKARLQSGTKQTDVIVRPSPPAPATYEVKQNDTLYGIAKKTLGNGSRWREIYEANRKTIGTNPDLIIAGQILVIPGGRISTGVMYA